MKKLALLQSGGPTSVINASLYGVAKSFPGDVLGSRYGIDGLIEGNLIPLKDLPEALKVTPGAHLGSARHKLPEDLHDPIYRKIAHTLASFDIGYLVLIGGNDSMDSALQLDRYFQKEGLEVHVIGCPKSIDNDLMVTDHCPGYGSAIKFIATSLMELRLDTLAYEKGRVNLVEIMGRDSGWLAAGAKLACLRGEGPDLIYLPEVPFDEGRFLSDVQKAYGEKGSVLVVVAEGLRDEAGHCLADGASDAFGHKQLGGVGQLLAGKVEEKLGLRTRAIELSLLQRSAGHLVSQTDLEEAEECGIRAAEAVLFETGKAIVMERLQSPYRILYGLADLERIAGKVKSVPLSWIKNGNDLTQEFLDYALPLIQGEAGPHYVDGLPDYPRR